MSFWIIKAQHSHFQALFCPVQKTRKKVGHKSQQSTYGQTGLSQKATSVLLLYVNRPHSNLLYSSVHACDPSLLIKHMRPSSSFSKGGGGSTTNTSHLWASNVISWLLVPSTAKLEQLSDWEKLLAEVLPGSKAFVILLFTFFIHGIMIYVQVLTQQGNSLQDLPVLSSDM